MSFRPLSSQDIGYQLSAAPSHGVLYAYSYVYSEQFWSSNLDTGVFSLKTSGSSQNEKFSSSYLVMNAEYNRIISENFSMLWVDEMWQSKIRLWRIL